MKRKSSPNELKVEKKLKNKKPNIEELSEYEKMVQKNRDEKAAFLQTLRMDEVKEGLNEAIRSLKPKNLPSSTKSVMTAQVPTRKSSRLKKVDINYTWKAVEARALAEAKKEIKKPPILTFEEAITVGSVYTDFVHDFDDLDFKTPKPFTDYVSCFENMKIENSKIAKVTHDRITAMAFHPMEEKVIVIAGDTLGAVGFWHVDSDSVPYKFKPHTFEVGCLKFNSDSPNKILSCSYDGTMRYGDMERKVFDEVFNISHKTSCSYFDFTSPTTTIVSHGDGKVSLVDIRTLSKSAEISIQCHNYPVETVCVHPVDKSYFVSADRKGFLSLWDLRKVEWSRPVKEVHHHKKVITSALFSPVTGNSILTASDDNSVSLFDCSKFGRSSLKLKRRMMHNNIDMLQTPLKAIWLPNTDDAFVIGSVDNPKRIEVFNNRLKSIYKFQDDYLRCTTTTNIFHPSLPVLAGGSYSGKVFIFS